MNKFKNFSDFNFEVIDVTLQGTPDLTINLNGLTFNQKLVENMGYPSFVRPLIDAENKVFAIQACKMGTDKAIKFSKPQKEQTTRVAMSATTILRILRSLMRNEWDEEHRYQITGMYHATEKAMIFDLKSAKELAPFKGGYQKK